MTQTNAACAEDSCRQCGSDPSGSPRADWRADERCRACGSVGTDPGTPDHDTVRIELPRAAADALCDVLRTLENKAKKGDWWRERWNALGDAPQRIRIAVGRTR